MITIRYGGKKGRVTKLAESDEYVVVRTKDRRALPNAQLATRARAVLQGFDRVLRFKAAGVEVLRATVDRGARGLRDEARSVLKREDAIEFAGRVLVDRQSNEPVLYTENVFVKFEDDATESQCRKVLKAHHLEIKRPLGFVRNAYFVWGPEGIGQKIFEIADTLLDDPAVEFCHAETVREVRRRAAFPGQWHLKRMSINGSSIDAHANVEAAWAHTAGVGSTIAIIDDGVDLDHEEFRSAGKIVSPRDATFDDDDPRPGEDDNHGTACAGVAAGDGLFGAAGVAPGARLMPIRLVSGLGSVAEAEAFQWAADHGADVISCSWGPPDGRWWDPNDPRHNRVVALPDSTRLAIDYATRNGRNGRGCVVCFAAGNGNESVDNDGYASYQGVIAVAACNDRSKKSAYSDFGRAIWCSFPSSNGEDTLTPGIFTTDRTGVSGYNPGQESLGDEDGHYTNDFGGTSSACPGVAGVAALVLARNPQLRWDEVRDVIRRSCDRIDPSGGAYNAEGRSPKYGFGRVNALKAVELAVPPAGSPTAVHERTGAEPIRDKKSASLSIPVADARPITELKVRVDIDHTYIGDLVVKLVAPANTGVAPIILHNREGKGIDNLKRTFDPLTTPALLQLAGKSPAGTWRLVVEDKAAFDTGTLKAVGLEMKF